MDDQSVKSDLPHAIRLAKAGEREKARQVLLQIVRASPTNQVAWFWLVEVTDSHAERVRILQQCLQANPASERVKKALAKLVEDEAILSDRADSHENLLNTEAEEPSLQNADAGGSEEAAILERRSSEAQVEQRARKKQINNLWVQFLLGLMLLALLAVAVWVLTLYNDGHRKNVAGQVILTDETATPPLPSQTVPPHSPGSTATGVVQRSTETKTFTSTPMVSTGKETVFSPSPFVPVGTATQAARPTISQPPEITLSLLYALDGAAPIAVNPIGNLIASLTPNRPASIQLWDPTTGEMVRSFGQDSHVVRCLAFSADGKILATGAEDQQIFLWDFGTGKLIRAFVRHSAPVAAIDFNADQRIVGSVDRSPAMLLWIFQDYDILRRVEGLRDRIYDLDFSPNGDLLATGGADSAVRIWRVSDGQQVQLLVGHADAVRSVVFRSDGKFLASGSGLSGKDQSVWLWNIETGMGTKLIPTAAQPVLSVAFSADGKILAAGFGGDGPKNGILLWHVDSGNLLLSYEIAEAVKDVAFTRDGSRLLVATDDHLFVFNLLFE